MARWTQPNEVREYARVAHAFIDAFCVSMDLIVIERNGRHHTGRLVRSSTHQDPHAHPPRFAGEFTIEDEDGKSRTFDILEVRDVFPKFLPQQAAEQLSNDD